MNRNPNQWDSYPAGQGVTALEFLQKMNKESFIEKARQSSFITDDEFKQLWVECGANPDDDFVSMDVSKRFSERYPHLHRDCGADIYEMVANSQSGLKTRNSLEFAADSLFCEWCYVVDLDKNSFEVYKGFNTMPLNENERFAFLNDISFKNNQGKKSYFPVKFVAEFDLDELPTKEVFIQTTDPREEEEE